VALGALLWAMVSAAQPPGPKAAAPAGGRAPPAQPPADTPDEDFIEFLGKDDHGDPAWSDMVKKAQQQPGQQNPPPPSQGTKQS
jgi:hypothetical protein